MSAEVLTGEIVPYGEKIGHRPLSYTKEIGQEICERLSLGESLSSICRDEGMPHRVTVHRWLLSDDEKLAAFCIDYARARELQADTHVDEMTDIADDGVNDWMEQHDKDGALIGWRVNGEHIQRSKLRIDTRKWTAAKMRPKKYGDSTLLKHGDAEGDKLPSQDQSILELARIVAFALSKAEKIVDKGVTIEQEG